MEISCELIIRVGFEIGTDWYATQCTKSVYPFHDGKFEDFEEVFNYMIDVSSCGKNREEYRLTIYRTKLKTVTGKPIQELSSPSLSA